MTVWVTVGIVWFVGSVAVGVVAGKLMSVWDEYSATFCVDGVIMGAVTASPS
jgi:hypothetical protein